MLRLSQVVQISSKTRRLQSKRPATAALLYLCGPAEKLVRIIRQQTDGVIS